MDKKIRVGSYVKIPDKDGHYDVWNNPDCEGRVDKIEGDYAYVSNMNMPFLGSYIYKKFPLSVLRLTIK